MQNHWVQLLQELPLSRTEKEVARRFERDPEGRSFLPITDILRNHRLYDESLELLAQGVAAHPKFTVARVVLVRELLQKGMVLEAWRSLEESPLPLRDNLLAQKLRFRLAVLLRMESAAMDTYQILERQQMVDKDIKAVGDAIKISGFDKARDQLIDDFRARQVDLLLPEPTDDDAAGAGSGEELVDKPIATFEFDWLKTNKALDQFHVVPLNEVFQPDERAASSSPDAIELDSSTMADIYAKQGHYGKALAIYRRLLKMSPGNDVLKRKVAEYAKLDKEQKEIDLTIDPGTVDRMETIEIIDRQIRFYNDLLERF